MPCDTKRKSATQTLEERNREIAAALRRLEQALLARQAKVVISATGAVAFAGWADRDDVTDVCAYRTLMVQGSWALRQAVARAEAMQGRKVNANAVAAGVHSHDGGQSWNKGH